MVFNLFCTTTQPLIWNKHQRRKLVSNFGETTKKSGFVPGRVDIENLIINPLVYSVIFPFGGVGGLFGGVNPPLRRDWRGDGLELNDRRMRAVHQSWRHWASRSQSRKLISNVTEVTSRYSVPCKAWLASLYVWGVFVGNLFWQKWLLLRSSSKIITRDSCLLSENFEPRNRQISRSHSAQVAFNSGVDKLRPAGQPHVHG